MGGAIYFNMSASNSLNSSMGIGISALQSARLALQTVGHNIANVNTPGFSRQYTVQSPRAPQITPIGSIGRGVDVTSIEAVRDRFIEAQLATETQEKGRLGAWSQLMERIETIYNPATSLGLNEAADSLFGGFADLAANPENVAQREALIQSGEGMAMASNHTITQMKGIKASINEQIKAAVRQANVLLEDIANMNVQLAGSDALGQSNEDVRDQRNLAFRELSELIDVQGYTDEDGALTIVTAGGSPLIVGNQFAELSTTPNSLDNNAVDIFATFNGSPANITKLIRGGTIGALLDIRDNYVEGAISNQRLFAAVLADAVNIEHRQGTDLAGNAGGDFFEDPFRVISNSAASTIDSINMVGDNATFEVNYSITANATSGVTITDINIDEPNVADLTKHDYVITFDTGGAAGDYTITDDVTKEVVATGNLPAAGTITFEGLSVDFDGVPAAGDEYTLNFDGRTGMTGDVYNIEWTSATDYEVYNISEKDITPVAAGTLAAGAGFVFFDGLAVHFGAGARAAGDTFKIDYQDMATDANLTATGIAASGSAPGLAEPGNNENALRLTNLGQDGIGILDSRTFSMYQTAEISGVGSERAGIEVLQTAQGHFITSLENQREAVSGVSLDEEAANLIQYQQSYTAAARYISQVNDLLDFLISSLSR